MPAPANAPPCVLLDVHLAADVVENFVYPVVFTSITGGHLAGRPSVTAGTSANSNTSDGCRSWGAEFAAMTRPAYQRPTHRVADPGLIQELRPGCLPLQTSDVEPRWAQGVVAVESTVADATHRPKPGVVSELRRCPTGPD
jgi:hypothetical protein